MLEAAIPPKLGAELEIPPKLGGEMILAQNTS